MDACELVSTTTLKDEIYNMVLMTLRDGNERGFSVAIEGGEIVTTEIAEGGPTSVMIPRPLQTIGTFHTHPEARFDELFSIRDTKSMIENNFEFSGIGYFDDGVVKARVYTPDGMTSFDDLVQSTHDDRVERNRLGLVRAINDRLLDCELEMVE